MSTIRYLVTGGAGFIGSHIAETLLKQGESVRVFDNLATGRSSNLEPLQGLAGHFEFVQGDLRDSNAVRAAVEGVEVVFHQGQGCRSETRRVREFLIGLWGYPGIAKARGDAYRADVTLRRAKAHRRIALRRLHTYLRSGNRCAALL